MQKDIQQAIADLNILDLNLGNPFHVNRYFTINPSYGIKAAFINQNFKSRYSNIRYLTYSGEKAAFIAKNDFWGIGINGGINLEWLLSNNFYLYGVFNYAILYSHFNLNQKFESPQSDIAKNTQLQDDSYTNTTNFEQTLGFC